MSKIFNFQNITGHELYHLRYGKGAVIVALPEEYCEESSSIWDEKQKERADEARTRIKPIKLKIADLKKELREVVGGIRKINQPPSSEETRIRNEIEGMEQEKQSLHYSQKKYFSNMQLAMFYTHNISSKSDVHTWFDKVISIEELNTHVIIVLEFNGRLNENNEYHRIIQTSNPNISGRYERMGGNIEGVVKRVVPVDNVTLEIITRQ